MIMEKLDSCLNKRVGFGVQEYRFATCKWTENPRCRASL